MYLMEEWNAWRWKLKERERERESVCRQQSVRCTKINTRIHTFSTHYACELMWIVEQPKKQQRKRQKQSTTKSEQKINITKYLCNSVRWHTHTMRKHNFVAFSVDACNTYDTYFFCFIFLPKVTKYVSPIYTHETYFFLLLGSRLVENIACAQVLVQIYIFVNSCE